MASLLCISERHDLVSVLDRLATGSGHRFAHVWGTADAAAFLARQRPDVLVIDSHLPPAETHAFLQSFRLSDELFDLPVLLIGRSPLLESAAQGTCRDIGLPVRPAEFEQAIADLASATGRMVFSPAATRADRA